MAVLEPTAPQPRETEAEAVVVGGDATLILDVREVPPPLPPPPQLVLDDVLPALPLATNVGHVTGTRSARRGGG